MRNALLLCLIVLAASPALANVSLCASRIGAQPRCKKGCPCGNACISCSNTCRISTRPVTPIPAEIPVPAPPASEATKNAVTSPSRGLISTPANAIWVASSANRLFFLSTCPLTPAIPTSDRIDVKDTTALTGVGFRRLLVPGC